jgi:hypothetical protein
MKTDIDEYIGRVVEQASRAVANATRGIDRAAGGCGSGTLPSIRARSSAAAAARSCGCSGSSDGSDTATIVSPAFAATHPPPLIPSHLGGHAARGAWAGRGQGRPLPFATAFPHR